MTSKEKALELVDKFTIPYYEWDGDGYNINWDETFKNRKQCALIAADEVINTIMSVYQPETKAFWFEVKQEIKNL